MTQYTPTTGIILQIEWQSTGDPAQNGCGLTLTLNSMDQGLIHIHLDGYLFLFHLCPGSLNLSAYLSCRGYRPHLCGKLCHSGCLYPPGKRMRTDQHRKQSSAQYFRPYPPLPSQWTAFWRRFIRKTSAGDLQYNHPQHSCADCTGAGYCILQQSGGKYALNYV